MYSGPVSQDVFGAFKEYRWNVIDRAVCPLGQAAVIEHVDSVLEKYGKYGATELERLTPGRATVDMREGVWHLTIRRVTSSRKIT